MVEVFAGADGGARSLVVPVTELSAAAGAALSYVSLQVLGGAAWSVARLAARWAGGSTLRTFTLGLGAAYGRIRTDVAVDGRDASCEVLSTYLGDGAQVHDIRTLQDHAAPRTTSELLCQGAVAGHSRSVYSGLIRVHRGAVRTDARQTNHNLVLDEGAHADSVPNLDILENDVKCSHASTVGPIDEDQRYYIESRGVAPEVAEGSSCSGFFDAIVDRGPVPALSPLLRREVHDRLGAALGRRRPAAGVGDRGALPRQRSWPPARPGALTSRAIGSRWCASDDTFHAVDDECSHEDYSLAEGEVWADECEIECPRHGSTFDLRTGEPCSLPATQPVHVYEVEVADGTVSVVLP